MFCVLTACTFPHNCSFSSAVTGRYVYGGVSSPSNGPAIKLLEHGSATVRQTSPKRCRGGCLCLCTLKTKTVTEMHTHKESTAKDIPPNDERMVQLLVLGALWSSLAHLTLVLTRGKSAGCSFRALQFTVNCAYATEGSSINTCFTCFSSSSQEKEENREPLCSKECCFAVI